jgi:hypothetical protein
MKYKLEWKLHTLVLSSSFVYPSLPYNVKDVSFVLGSDTIFWVGKKKVKMFRGGTKLIEVDRYVEQYFLTLIRRKKLEDV